MSDRAVAEPMAAVSTWSAPSRLLQRACACGQHTPGGECEACRLSRARDGSSAEHGAARGAGPAVSRPDDPAEVEADQVADDVLRAPLVDAPGLAASTVRHPSSSSFVARAAEPDTAGDSPDQHERAHEPRNDEDDDEVRRRAAGQGPDTADPDTADRLRRRRGAGEPLPPSVRAFFEPRLAADLGPVRVHTDPEAGRLAHAVSALAFTQGQDIYFAPGQFSPHTVAGRRLLAHELTHTLQGPAVGSVVEQVRRRAAVASDPYPAGGSGADAALLPPAPGTAGLAADAAPAADSSAAVDTAGQPTPSPDAGERADGDAVRTPGGPPPGLGLPSQPGVPGQAPPTPAAVPGEEPPANAGPDGAAGAAPAPATGPQLLQSLTTVRVSQFATATTAATQATQELQSGERADLAASLPTIDRPSGLPRLAEREAPAPTVLPTAAAPEPAPPGPREQPPAPTETPAPAAPLPADAVRTDVTEPAAEDDGGGWWDWLRNAVQRFLGRLPTSDPSVDTSAGERPRVDRTGDANPAQNAQAQHASTQTVSGHQAHADEATTADFGEHGIYPDVPHEPMRPRGVPAAAPGAPGAAAPPGGATEAAPPGAAGAAAAGGTPAGGVPDVVLNGADRAAGGWLQGQVGQRVDQEARDRADMDRDSSAEREQSHQDIEDETARIRTEQERSQADAGTAVAQRREQWREENRQVAERYGQQADERRGQTDGDIESRTTSAQQRADDELGRAEREAAEKKRETERKAAEKKKEAENRPRGFWDRVKGAVSDFFDAIKSAINSLFNALRRFVRDLIDRAKRFARGLIEAARRAIVGLIHAFGDFLKGLVTIALAAFPEAAERARRFIDDRVDEAVGAVNRAADALQTAVQALLDALGNALDAILALYQRAFNLLIDGLRLLAVGILELLERIGHLIEAARHMPDHFFGQLTEELVGQDLTAPLPFERTEAPAPRTAVATALAAGAIAPADATALTRTTAPDGSVDVDAVAPMELSRELLGQVDLADGESREFGENSDPSRTMAAVQEELAGGGPEGGGFPPGPADAEGTGTLATTGPSGTVPQQRAPEETQAPAAPAAEETPEQETERELSKRMNVEPDPPCPKEASEHRADQGSVPEEMKIGPLSVGQRARYLGSQMLKGVRNWLSCNWPWLLAGAIAALAVGIILEIITGGAITAAIPPLMELAALVMIGVALYRVASYVGEYLTKGWDGQIQPAAKSLARGLAIGAIELIFTLLFDLNSVLKAAKQGLTATIRGAFRTGREAVGALVHSAGRVVRGVGRAIRAPGRAAALVGRVTLRRGRMIFQGLRRGFAQGARSLEELATRLWSLVRFRRFKLERHGRLLVLFGYINPWVPLAELPLDLAAQVRRVFTPEEIDQIAQRGRLLGLDETEIDHFLAVGSISKPAKGKQPLSVGDVLEQMDNWVNTIRPRGYPYKFASKEQFDWFRGELESLLAGHPVPRGKVILQGSALRNPAARDIDIAIFVSDEAFAAYALQCEQAILRRAANPLAAERIVGNLRQNVERGFIPQFFFDRPPTGGSFSSALHDRIIPTLGFEMDVSVMKSSSSLALRPFLEL